MEATEGNPKDSSIGQREGAGGGVRGAGVWLKKNGPWIFLAIWCLALFGPYLYVPPGAKRIVKGRGMFSFANQAGQGSGIYADVKQVSIHDYVVEIYNLPNEEPRQLSIASEADCLAFPPLVFLDRQVAFVLDARGRLSCISAEAELLWQVQASKSQYDSYWGCTALEDLIIVSNERFFFAFSKDGSFAWQRDADNWQLLQQAGAANESVYLSRPGMFARLDESGELSEEFTAPGLTKDSYAWTAGSDVLYTRKVAGKPDVRELIRINSDGELSAAFGFPEGARSETGLYFIWTVEQLPDERLLLGTTAGVFIVDTESGDAAQLSRQDANQCTYLPVSDRIIYEDMTLDQLAFPGMLFTMQKLVVSDVNGQQQKSYLRKNWMTAGFSEDASGNIYMNDYNGNLWQLK